MNNVLYDVWFSAMLINRQDIYNKLIEKYETSEKAFKSFTKEDIFNFSDEQKSALLKKDLKIAENILKRCQKEGIEIINSESMYYPELLKYTDMPPAVLYAKGNIEKLKMPKVTVIGSRQCDKEGVQNARRFSKTFSDVGLCVVAGFAPGIEAYVHKEVLSTIVILPCGINVTYPSVHFRLKNSILENGGLLISEYPFGVRAFKENFKFRNRLLAGISDAVVFVQCGMKSGTAHTFNWAALYGREAYVIPGSINSIFYKGSNSYIREGGILITCPEDVLINYFSNYPHLIEQDKECDAELSIAPEIDFESFDIVDDNEKIILKALSGKIMHIDELIKETNISVRVASVSLTNLELLNMIEKCEGNRYRIKR